MPTVREIQAKSKSIKNTKKITKAMEMISSCKMRKAQERMTTSRPYASKIRQVIGHLAKAHSEYHHPYLTHKKDIKNVGYIVVSTDRGLCGGFNLNMFKLATKSIKTWQQKDANIDICMIGNKGESIFRNLGNLVAHAKYTGDKPTVHNLIGVIKVMLDSFEQGKLDALYIIANEFVNSMVQKPYIEQLLPLPPAGGKDLLTHHWDYLYEPDAKILLDRLLKRYVESQIYQTVVENLACEQAARMIAMKSATDNAEDMLHELQLDYNKARQASITTELAEIVSGAAAV